MELREDDRDEDDPETGLGGSGDVAVAKSSVARLSLSPAGAPQAEQKRTLPGKSVLQEGHLGMDFPVPVYLAGMRICRTRVYYFEVTMLAPERRTNDLRLSALKCSAG